MSNLYSFLQEKTPFKFQLCRYNLQKNCSNLQKVQKEIAYILNEAKYVKNLPTKHFLPQTRKTLSRINNRDNRLFKVKRT